MKTIRLGKGKFVFTKSKGETDYQFLQAINVWKQRHGRFEVVQRISQDVVIVQKANR